ncbi:hypothetical protein D3C78_374930 [compost metagenome]
MGGAVIQQAVQFGVLQRCAQASADDQQFKCFQFAGNKVSGHQLQAQVAQHPVAVQRQWGEAEAVGAQQVGGDQHVHGHGETGHGEVFEQDEVDAVGRLGAARGGLEPQHVGGAGLLAELAWGGHSGLRFLDGLASVAGS